MSKENNITVNWGLNKVISKFRVYSNEKKQSWSGILEISKVYILFKLWLYTIVLPMLNWLKVNTQQFIYNIAQGHTEVNVCLKNEKVVKF